MYRRPVTDVWMIQRGFLFAFTLHGVDVQLGKQRVSSSYQGFHWRGCSIDNFDN
jgi:hypothetical protein